MPLLFSHHFRYNLATLDTIFVEGIEFYGYHGASDEEQRIGHRFIVDVEVGFDTRKAGQSDALTDTVNYALIAKRIVQIGENAKYRLLEALADCLSKTILKEFPVEHVRLHVRKVHPPMHLIVSAVGVRIERHRE